jgi:hypothetical protein
LGQELQRRKALPGTMVLRQNADADDPRRDAACEGENNRRLNKPERRTRPDSRRRQSDQVPATTQKHLGGYRPELPHAGDMEMWLRFAAHGGVGRIHAFRECIDDIPATCPTRTSTICCWILDNGKPHLILSSTSMEHSSLTRMDFDGVCGADSQRLQLPRPTSHLCAATREVSRIHAVRGAIGPHYPPFLCLASTDGQEAARSNHMVRSLACADPVPFPSKGG